MSIHLVHVEDDRPLKDILSSVFRATNPKVDLHQFTTGDETVAYAPSADFGCDDIVGCRRTLRAIYLCDVAADSQRAFRGTGGGVRIDLDELAAGARVGLPRPLMVWCHRPRKRSR